MDTASPMVIGNQLAQTITGANHAINHMLYGDENESSTCIQGSPRDVVDMYDGAKNRGSKFATMQFVVAPKSQMSREHFLQHVLPRLAKRFGFAVLQAVIFEHEKERAAGKDIAGRLHWHIIVNYRDPLSGRVNPGWSWSHAKCECVSREIEALGLDGDSMILLGRFQKQVIKQLRLEGLHAVADLIEAAHPPGATPENRTPPPEIEQPAKAAGVDLRELGKQVKEAFHTSANREDFIVQLEQIGLTLGVSNRSEKPAWAICGGPDGGFLNLLSRCLPGVSRVKIHTKLGEPENVGNGAAAGDERRAEIAVHAELDQHGGEGPAEGRQVADHAAVEPGGPVHGGGSAGYGRAEELFVEALSQLDAETSVLDRLMADALALTWGSVATFVKYFRNVELAARRWLDDRKTKLFPQRPAASVTLEALRKEGKFLKENLGTANTTLQEIGDRISRMLGQPAPNVVGAQAHQKRLAEAEKEYNDAEAARKAASEAYEEHEKRARVFEDELADRQARWDEAHDKLAHKWLAIAKAALDTMKQFPLIAKYGPEAVFMLGLVNFGKPNPTLTLDDDDDYSSKGPRGPK
jgi:hypothetical protein